MARYRLMRSERHLTTCRLHMRCFAPASATQASGHQQVVLSHAPVRIQIVDAPASGRSQFVRGHLRRLVSEPFCFDTAPWVRVLVCSLGSREHLISWALPHMVLDGAAAAILTRDFIAAYRAHVEGLPGLPSGSLQIGDIAHQRADQKPPQSDRHDPPAARGVWVAGAPDRPRRGRRWVHRWGWSRCGHSVTP